MVTFTRTQLDVASRFGYHQPAGRHYLTRESVLRAGVPQIAAVVQRAMREKGNFEIQILVDAKLRATENTWGDLVIALSMANAMFSAIKQILEVQ